MPSRVTYDSFLNSFRLFVIHVERVNLIKNVNIKIFPVFTQSFENWQLPFRYHFDYAFQDMCSSCS